MGCRPHDSRVQTSPGVPLCSEPCSRGGRTAGARLRSEGFPEQPGKNWRLHRHVNGNGNKDYIYCAYWFFRKSNRQLLHGQGESTWYRLQEVPESYTAKTLMAAKPSWNVKKKSLYALKTGKKKTQRTDKTHRCHLSLYGGLYCLTNPKKSVTVTEWQGSEICQSEAIWQYENKAWLWRAVERLHYAGTAPESRWTSRQKSAGERTRETHTQLHINNCLIALARTKTPQHPVMA